MITMKRSHFYFALMCALFTGQFIIPLAWKTATAQVPMPPRGIEAIGEATMAAGVDPDGKMAQIRVDGDGHVICSTEAR